MAIEDNVEHFEDPSEKSKWDISRMPCVRRSLIHGIVGGLIVGFGVFSIKRHVMKSCDYAVGGSVAIAVGSFSWCTYKRYQETKKLEQIKEMLSTYSKQKEKERAEASEEKE